MNNLETSYSNSRTLSEFIRIAGASILALVSVAPVAAGENTLTKANIQPAYIALQLGAIPDPRITKIK